MSALRASFSSWIGAVPFRLRSFTRLTILVGGVCFALAVIAIPARATYGAQTTADEPQYLMTALSLANDGNLDISDEIDGNEFRSFHENSLNEQTFPLDQSGRRVSPHDPLLPVYLAPFMAAGGWQGAKVGLALVSALTAMVTLRLSVEGLKASPIPSALTVISLWAGAPLSAYGTQVYPEMPAALAVVLGLFWVTRPGRWTTAGSSLMVIALPWLAIKYAPVAAAVAIVILADLAGWFGLKPKRWKSFALVVAGWGIAGIAYLVIHQRIYGGWTVYSTGDHFVESGEFSVVGIDPDYVGRSRRLVGLLVDQKFGIATWHPAWFLAPFAMTWAIFRFKTYRLFAAVFVAGLVTSTFVALTMQGWWFPGRQMVVVLPLAVVAMTLLASEYNWALWTTIGGGVAGAINWIWLVSEASSGNRTLIVDHWELGAWPYRAIFHLMPDGLSSGAAPIVGLSVWGALLAASMAAGAKLGSSHPTTRDSVA